jgi:hypothetical protein
MKHGVAILPLGLALLLTGGGASQAGDLSERRVLEESFGLVSGGRLVVDNVHGSIRITGTARDQVRMSAVETIEADDPEALELARREVELVTHAEEGLVDLYVDGPFRERDDRGWRRHRRRHYRVSYDFTLEVPAGIDLEVSTVNDGEIFIDGVHGDFEVSNVNGGIEMLDLRGSGSISTVNGPIRARFSRSPAAASRFETVNGEVEVYFPDDLSAELALDSRFGEIWSEFEVVAMPVETTQTTEGGKTIIEMGGPIVRVAQGGPRLSFETLNGDVLIRRHGTR